MGLDMYALTIDEKPEGRFEFDYADAERIYSWRKHPDLHGWMEDLYIRLGGDLEFNCIPLLLTSEDLDRLEADIKAGRLPQTSGFFFGKSDGSEKEGDLAFIAIARKALAEGKYVFYDSWW